MPLAHGLYSVGILIGAVAAGLARNAGAHREPILIAVAVLLAITAALLGASARAGASGAGGPLIRVEHALLVLGVRLRGRVHRRGRPRELERALPRARSSTPHRRSAASGPASSARRWRSAASTGRRTRFGDRTLLVGGGLLGAGGCLLAAAAPSSPVALVGLALGGAGVALYAPIVFGAGGRRGASAVATVTTLGYFGLLVGPALVGGVAQLTSLRGSFIVLALIAASVGIAARRAKLD